MLSPSGSARRFRKRFLVALEAPVGTAQRPRLRLLAQSNLDKGATSSIIECQSTPKWPCKGEEKYGRGLVEFLLGKVHVDEDLEPLNLRVLFELCPPLPAPSLRTP